MSGGQKQRLAIARALIKKPNILILDEATSALDPQSEQEVQQAIDNLQQHSMTIIMIAHRLQTIETAQNLLYIKGPKDIISAEKGSKEYGKIMNLLKTETYKHQFDGEESSQLSDDVEIPLEKENHGFEDDSPEIELDHLEDMFVDPKKEKVKNEVIDLDEFRKTSPSKKVN